LYGSDKLADREASEMVDFMTQSSCI